MNVRSNVARLGTAVRSTTGKVVTGVGSLVAAGVASAQTDVAGAVTTEITSGKASVSGILVVLAGVLGLFLLWSMIKRAK
ncbi:hypothetical protein HF319_02960 [Xanthomonas sp. Kuri4-1]